MNDFLQKNANSAPRAIDIARQPAKLPHILHLRFFASTPALTEIGMLTQIQNIMIALEKNQSNCARF